MQADAPSLGWAAIDWIEHYLVHGPGDVQGQAVELDAEFAAFVVKAYELKPRAGARIKRRAFLSRAKGRSKSGLAGFIECFEALGPCRFDHWAEEGEISDWGYEYEEGEPVGAPLRYVECLNVATEEDQAGNTYDAVYYILNPDTCSDELLADYGAVDVGLAQINLPDKRGFIKPVTSADKSADGGKSTFIVADETHLWVLPRLKRLHGVMTRNLLKRKIASGWMLETSTMYAEGEDSVAEGTHAYAKNASEKVRRALLFDHRQADQKWDLNKRSERLKALREAYGPAAAWMDLQALADSWDDPQVTEADFRRYWLNQPVPLVEKPPSLFPTWAGLRLEDGVPVPRIEALGIMADFQRVWLSLGSYGGGHLGAVEKLSYVAGKAEFIAYTARVALKLDVPVAIQEKTGAALLAEALTEKGVRVELVPFAGVARACDDIADAITTAQATHGDYDALNAAVEIARWTDVGKQRVFDSKAGDVSMLEAVTLARHIATAGAPVEVEPWAAWT
ncbi:hypothetical protein [Promicromonospora sp. NPDC023805]|uniref:hypothetical protein n=1 Tax=Promicromonospora sp. NPDC023805 TaxID=3154696 RepID=UPI0033DD554B